MNDPFRGRIARPLRYLLSGGIAWLVDAAVFFICLPIAGVALSQLAARTVGAAVAFVGHKLFVFRAFDYHPTALARQTLRYVVLWVVSYSVSTLALIGLIEHLHWNAVAAKVTVEAGILVMNYLVMKTVIFHRTETRETPE